MKNVFKKCVIGILALTVIINLSACSATKNANDSQKGSAIGAATGSILGAIIANNSTRHGKKGNSKLGAALGGILGGAAGALIGKKMDKQAQKISEEIPGATVERIDNGIVVTFDENSGVYFETNKHDINVTSEALLNKLSNILNEYPDTNVLVVGHTDSAGAEAYNLMLSKNRAESVTNFFVNKGLNASRFTTSWYGEEKPIADNSTAEGREKNRRVNIAIIPNETMENTAKRETGQN